ncbi:MAG: hypothetical protein JWO99_873 [Candidatus Saccharibacteria bacterium]|nr:hypothetical protein [Candidatus Saccharibacteria bacterium]
MATYKVPQDVEADDKLIGPFSFRQFIYLIIVALSGAAAWGLSQLFIGLAIIPLPVILLFGALALPLRKDQPMEIYLAAIISYYLKPHKRLWDPDGVESLIEITVPKIVEVQRSKNITQADAEQRFSYLAGIVDSGGWAIRGTGAQASPSTVLNNDIFLEAQGAQDVLDGNNSVAQTFNTMISKEADRMRQEAIDRMHAPTVATPALVVPIQPEATPIFNPYPTNIQQSVIQPMNDPSHMTTQPASAPVPPPAPQTATTTSDKPVSADIINLANNSDVSIETLASEAHRLQQKEDDMSQEVVISLR